MGVAAERRSTGVTAEVLVHLAEYVSSSSLERLPDDIGALVRRNVLDWIGAACAGASAPEGRVALDLQRWVGSSDAATVIGGRTADPIAAALVNGMLGHVLELDDAQATATGLHAGSAVIPAALALGEATRAEGATIVAAVAAGYEISGRLGAALGVDHRRRGFHSTGTVGAIGAAASASRVLGLTVDQTVSAMAVAASQASGLFAFLSDGSTVKQLHSGRAASSGVLAAVLAKLGMTGPKAVLEDSNGFFNAYAGTRDPARIQAVAADLGSEFAIRDVYLKRHASCGHLAPAIDAALALVPDGVKGEEVERVEVSTYWAAAVLDDPEPTTAAGARYSMQYNVAHALRYGSISPSAFDERCLRDSDTRALARRVSVREDPSLSEAYPATREAHVRIVLRDRVLEGRVTAPRGMPANPLTPDEVVAKFESLATTLLAPDVAREVRQLIDRLEDLPNVSGLCSRLAKGVSSEGRVKI